MFINVNSAEHPSKPRADVTRGLLYMTSWSTIDAVCLEDQSDFGQLKEQHNPSGIFGGT